MTVTTISGNVTYSVDTTITAGNTLRFDPAVSSVLTIDNKNLIIDGGVLEMKPNAGITAKIRFTNIIEANCSDGGGMVVVAADKGLWVMGAGRLDLLGKQKSGWLRTTAGLAAGATSLTLESTPVGWQVGDEISIVPSTPTNPATPTAPANFNRFEVKTITAISGATVSWSGGLTDEHPAVPAPISLTPEVMNLTRTVNIEGQDGTHRAHMFIHTDTHPHSLKYVGFRYLGPQKNGTVIVGRWPIHFHHCLTSSTGTVCTGLVNRDTGSHPIVPHVSDGITWDDCIAYQGIGGAYWWDTADTTNDCIYTHCIVAKLAHGPDGGQPNGTAGFLALRGLRNEMTDCVAVGVESGGSGAGFAWPEAANATASNWLFEDCVSHNNKVQGLRIWQNSMTTTHTYTRFKSYYNGAPGLVHGAYTSSNQIFDSVHYGNWGTQHEQRGARRQPPVVQPLQDGDIYYGGNYGVTFQEHAVGTTGGFVRFINCQFIANAIKPIQINDGTRFPSFGEFVHCTTNGVDLQQSDIVRTHMQPGGIIRVQRNDNTAFQMDSNGTFTDIPPFYGTAVALGISSLGLTSGAVGTAYSETVQAEGGTTPYTWAITSGTLPTGLSLNTSTGAITGTPTVAGTSTFTIRVTDNVAATASRSLSIVVAAGASINIDSDPPPHGYLGTSYTHTFEATGGVGAQVWLVSGASSFVESNLPAGVELDFDEGLGGGTGVISGTPLDGGLFTFTMQVQDSQGHQDEQEFSLRIYSGHHH